MVPIFLVLLYQNASSPHYRDPNLQSQDLQREIKTNDHELFAEVSWRKCSAKKLTAYLHSTIKIRCEFWAPLGINVTWYKDDRIEAFQGHAQFQKQEFLDKKYLGVDMPENELPKRRRKYEFHLASYFFIPCMSEDYQGDYKIEVEVPNGKTFARTFELSSIGYSQLHSRCINEPIIEEFAKSIIGKEGESLYLPCRPSSYYLTAIVWKREENRQFSEDNYYSITDYGDLFIKNLTALDQGYFICELYSTSYDQKYDDMATFVKVVD